MKKVVLFLIVLIGFVYQSCQHQQVSHDPVRVFDLIDSLSVEKNPAGIAPLTALLKIYTTINTTWEYEIKGKHPVGHAGSLFNDEHDIPIYGLYANHENLIELRLADEEGNYQLDTLYVQTDPLPELMPTLEIITINPDLKEPGFTFSLYETREGFVKSSCPFVFDDEGSIRWFMDVSHIGSTGSPGEFLQNGNLILGFDEFICEFDWLGNEVNRFELTGYKQHHDIFEKPDGNLIAAVTKGSIDSKYDHIIELDRNTGQVVNVWDLRESLDRNRHEFVNDNFDWAHINSVWYDERNDNLVLSARVQGVFCLSMENELLWIMAPHAGWGVNNKGQDCNDFLLTAIDQNGEPYPQAVQRGEENASDFSWTYGQHSVEVLPNGNIIAFDNGDRRNYDINSELYSRGVEYNIDVQNKTVQQIWEYGKERGEEIFSRYEGDMDVLPQTGNRMIGPAIIGNAFLNSARVIEIAGQEVVFEALIPFSFDDNERGIGVYRSERIDF